MKEVIVRTISGVLYISIILFAMFTSKEWFLGLFLILAIITMSEFFKLIKSTGYFAYLLLVAGFYFFSYKIIDFLILHIFLFCVVLVNFLLFKEIIQKDKISSFLKKKFLLFIFYIIGGFIFLTLIPSLNKDHEFKPQIIISVFALIWANDTFAYLIGKNFGKNKLLERISPNKTIEGFFGGLLGALGISLAIFFSFKKFLIEGIQFSVWVWMGLAVVISVTGTIGDLIQSQLKRQAGVKDSGIIMPGHGGMYDRLDSIIYASPFVYAFLLIVYYVS